MTDNTYYHNPRCSKSREGLKLIEQRGLTVEVVEYLKTPPSVSELKNICALLKLSPKELIRTKEKVFKELGLSLEDPKDNNSWLRILHEHPALIERPILIYKSKAVIGRPPEKILEILD